VTDSAGEVPGKTGCGLLVSVTVTLIATCGLLITVIVILIVTHGLLVTITVIVISYCYRGGSRDVAQARRHSESSRGEAAEISRAAHWLTTCLLQRGAQNPF